MDPERTDLPEFRSLAELLADACVEVSREGCARPQFLSLADGTPEEAAVNVVMPAFRPIGRRPAEGASGDGASLNVRGGAALPGRSVRKDISPPQVPGAKKSLVGDGHRAAVAAPVVSVPRSKALPPEAKRARAVQPRKKQNARRKRRIRFVHVAAGFALTFCILAAAGAMWVSAQAREVERTLPPVRMDLAAELSRKSFIYAADGTELAQLGTENRTWASLSDISPHVINALVATEDRRFFEHRGVDYKRLVSAGWGVITGEETGGASTLTMQLVRNVYPEIGRLPRQERKVRELLMAQRIERVYTKRDLLELYLNKMAFGRGSFGIEAAAETYFNKTATELQLHEAALLVGILKGPSFYDPVQHPERALERRRIVLASLVADQQLDQGVMNKLASEPLGLHMAPRSVLSKTAPHFAEHVRREMETWGRASGFDIYKDGLRVFTTLDPYLQGLAQMTVDHQMGILQTIAGQDWASGGQPFAAFWKENNRFEEQQLQRSERYGRLRAKGTSPGTSSYMLRADPVFMDSLHTATTRLETGLVAIDPHTGQIKAWVGSRDYQVDQYDKVGSARRQPGSTFKPILYAAAMEFGYTPDHLAEDVIQTYIVPPKYEPWRPTNAGGGATGQILTLRQALAKSKNTVSARLVQQVGPRRVVDMARRMGITSDLLAVPSIALGTSEVTLQELVSAYGTFVTEGMHYRSQVVSRIEDADGNVLASFGPMAERAMTSRDAYTVLDILRDVTRQGGTGAGLAARFPIPGEWTGKTGTTQDNTDGWFVAMHPDLVAGAWVGFNQPAVRFRSNHYGQGANNAGVVVADFLRTAVIDPMSGMGPARFMPPAGYVKPAPPADPFAGNLIDPERRWEYYGEPDPNAPIELNGGSGEFVSGPGGVGAPGQRLSPQTGVASPPAGSAPFAGFVAPPANTPGAKPAPDRLSTSRGERKRLVW
ncbi:MAG: penicillin-binding protein 1A [Rhodothermales bacterium]